MRYSALNGICLDQQAYHRQDCVVFWKTKEQWGGLSNMVSGYPLVVNGVRCFTSEALYQACRFPHLPDIQQEILTQKSPMSAKMKSKPHRTNSRPDWEAVRVPIMAWCLQVKLAQHWDRFAALLHATGDRPIVEQSRRDVFWGAKVVDDETLVGANILGQLLMQLRSQLQESEAEALWVVLPPQVSEFLLYGQKIKIINR